MAAKKSNKVAVKSDGPKIRVDYTPKGIEKDALERTYKRYWGMRDSPSRTRFSLHWDNWEKQWEAYRTPMSEDDWQSNIVPPLTTSIIEAIVAEMVRQRLRPLVVPRGIEDKPRARVMNHTVDYTCDIGYFDDELESVFRDSLKLGTAITQEYMFQLIRDVRFAKAIKQATQNKEAEMDFFDKKRLVEFDDPYMENVKLTEFFVDEMARSFRGPYQARDAIRRYVMHIDSFRQFFQGIWDPYDHAKLVKPGESDGFYEFYQPPNGISHEDHVEVLWYWSKFPDDALVIVANDVVMNMGPNPYNHKQLPFARAVDIKRTHQFYGKGESELLDSIQDELTLNRRMRLDRLHLSLDQMFLLSERVDLDEDELIVRPHGGIRVPDVERDIKPLAYSDTPRSAYLEEDRLKEDAVRVTGMDDRLQSVDAKAGTATEAAILKESTLKRVNMKLENIKRGFLVEWGQLRVANILQFYTQPKLEAILGEKFSADYQARVTEAKRQGTFRQINGQEYEMKYPNIRIEDKEIRKDKNGRLSEKNAKGFTFFEVKPEDIVPVYGSYHVQYEAGAELPISKPLLRQELNNLWDRIGPLALQGVGGYSAGKIMDMLVETYGKDPDELKVDEESGFEGTRAKAILLAIDENKRIKAGEQLGPTPFAPPAHTEIHMAEFEEGTYPYGSDEFIIMTRHIQGETMAQQQRGLRVRGTAGGGGGGLAPGRRAEASETGLSETLPGRIEGGADVSERIPVPRGGPQIIRKGAQKLAQMFKGQ